MFAGPYFYAFMHLLENLLLFAVTLLGGSLPIWTKGLNDARLHLLLAFSGSFLLSITFVHLLPESVGELGAKAGFCLLGGFFLQLLIQRFTHGMEHGHAHVHDTHGHVLPVYSIMAGLSVHAFMEGLPLGLDYTHASAVADHTATRTLYLAVTAHKLPETMLLTSLLLQRVSRSKAALLLLVFSAITPASSMLAGLLDKAPLVKQSAAFVVPVVAGAFIHIATTVFFESGTKQHQITRQKIVAMLAGVAAALLPLLFEA